MTLGVQEGQSGASCNKLEEAPGMSGTFLSNVTFTAYIVQVIALAAKQTHLPVEGEHFIRSADNNLRLTLEEIWRYDLIPGQHDFFF